MEGFLASVALTLLNADRLRGAIVFHSVEMQVKRGDFLESFGGFHELGITHQLHMTSYLEINFLNLFLFEFENKKQQT